MVSLNSSGVLSTAATADLLHIKKLTFISSTCKEMLVVEWVGNVNGFNTVIVVLVELVNKQSHREEYKG